MKRRMALVRSLTLVRVPRRMPWRVMMPKKSRPHFGQEPAVGVKCMVFRGFLASHVCTAGRGWGVPDNGLNDQPGRAGRLPLARALPSQSVNRASHAVGWCFGGSTPRGEVGAVDADTDLAWQAVRRSDLSRSAVIQVLLELRNLPIGRGGSSRGGRCEVVMVDVTQGAGWASV
jgi:hypothetical protein